jgi:serine/threonine-protein kinase
VKVLDFGISKLTSHVPGDPKLTETQSVFGSPTYMSPEQIRSAKKVDHRTDVWALGVVLHELLTNKLPFDADTVSGVLAAISADPPIPLRQLRPDAPPGLEAAILSCLQKDLTRRCQSLADFALALAPFASPVGAISADRISRIGGPKVSMMPPAPSSVSGDFSAASGITERSFATASTMLVKPRSPLFGVALGAGIAVVLVAAAALVFVLQKPRDTGAVASHAASASATLASSTALAGHSPTAATVTSVAPANPTPSAVTPTVTPPGTPSGTAPTPSSSVVHVPGKPNKPGVPSVASVVAPSPAPSAVPTATATQKPASAISDTSQ